MNNLWKLRLKINKKTKITLHILFIYHNKYIKPIWISLNKVLYYYSLYIKKKSYRNYILFYTLFKIYIPCKKKLKKIFFLQIFLNIHFFVFSDLSISKI